MNVTETILQVAAAALSVIGFYGILHALLEALLTPRELAAAVILTKYVPPRSWISCSVRPSAPPADVGSGSYWCYPSTCGRPACRRTASTGS